MLPADGHFDDVQGNEVFYGYYLADIRDTFVPCTVPCFVGILSGNRQLRVQADGQAGAHLSCLFFVASFALNKNLGSRCRRQRKEPDDDRNF